MLGKHLRIGMAIGDDLITGLQRNGEYTIVGLASGRAIGVHKFGTVDNVRHIVSIAAGPVRGPWYVSAPRVIRASDPEWRGESDGLRGERFIARNASFRAREER